MKFNYPSLLKAALITIAVSVFGYGTTHAQKRILIFTKTAGYHHASIPVGVDAIMKLGKENSFLVDTTSDAAKIVESNLKKYSALVFLSTTGSLLNNVEQADLERYIQAGGGFVGIHAAADAEYDWHWYGRMVGAYFLSHPAQQEAVINVVDKNDPSTKMLPAQWKRKDEWYNYKNISPDLHVLLTIDEKSYTGGKNGDFHPMAWYHNFEGGRVWYTELGHTDESYSDPLYLQHILGGIKYAIGTKPLDYAQVKAQRVPSQNRFTKVQLVTGYFYEPTEMTILPNLDILVVQRRGGIALYNHTTKTIKQVGFLDVYAKTITPKGKGVNAEEGVLGLQADPDFATNHYVYIYYSPTDTVCNRLSRFTLTGDTILNSSEKVILSIPTQREICCHTGGSIAFGKDHTLYLSAGDNTTPFDEPGKGYNTHAFAPLDDRPGHIQFDDRRSAGNTNDLRGKILRIVINKDGSYTIPEGNLFKQGTPLTKPEIYVMGDRNPYRISVDKKNSFLYWGEVGPDANNDSLETRGPKGYDEVNQARQAGNFGWPYFVGPNLAYHEYNYDTGVPGIQFDPAHPVNNSRNNTGLKDLPPAQPAFIWYPYGESKEFPQVGSGGRTAMAGPVFYADMYNGKSGGIPNYYDKKLFIYDWVRGWIKAVTMLPNGDYDSMEPFMDSTKFNAPVDMEMGPDGKMYVLEYGNGWFHKNPDAGLARIDFNDGNRPPEVTAVTQGKSAKGASPLSVYMQVAAADPENDKMTYTWNLGNGVRRKTLVPYIRYTYLKKGIYSVSVDAIDNKGAMSNIKAVNVSPGMAVVALSPALIAKQKQWDAGKTLMLSLDCKGCHKVDEKSVGPAFTDVSKRYENTIATVDKLSKKIMTGGTGVWGDVTMPAHPALKPEQTKLILNWIFSLSGKGK